MAEQRQITEQVKQANNGLVKDLRKREAWKGDHSACEIGHRDRLCCSIAAWRLDSNSKIVPMTIGRPSNKRFHSMVEYEGADAPEPQPAWRAKGWREAAESEGVRPIPAVVAKMRELTVEELERGMQFKKFEYADIEKAKAERLARFDAANKELLGETAPLVEGDSSSIVPPNPPKKGRASG